MGYLNVDFADRMIRVYENSTEGKILKFLMRNYPVTIDEIETKLKIKTSILKQKLRKFRRRGLVHLYASNDKIYVRLRRTNIELLKIGMRKPLHKKIVKHRIRRKVILSH